MKSALISKTIEIDGSAIHYLTNEADPDKDTAKPLLIFLHGFPENAFAWEPLICCLPEGYEVIAPDLPGYNMSSPLPNDSDYSVTSLLARLSAFVSVVQRDRETILVGHDWGGAIAWPLAAFHSELFSKLVIINAAHPSAFIQSLKHSRVQRVKSQYIKQLIDTHAENELRRTDFALFRKMLGENLFSENKSYAMCLLDNWRNDANLNAMLTYYRQMPQPVPPVDTTPDELDAIRVPNVRVSLPTLVLWGKNDDAFDTGILNYLPDYVTTLEIKYHEQATHWVHREQAQWAAEEIAIFIEGQKGRGPN